MKKTKKILSVVLAVIMAFSCTSVVFAGTLKTETYSTVETIIMNNSLAEIAGQLIYDLNGAKQNIAGTVIKFVNMFVDKPDLKKVIGDRDVTKLSGEENAKILLDWLNAYILPDLGNKIPDWVGKVATFIGLTVNLKTVDGVLSTVSSLCDLSKSFDLGIANNLNGNAIKGVKCSGGNLKVVYALIQFLADNSGVIKEAVKGNLNLGIVSNFVDLSDTEKQIKNLPVFCKAYIYLLIDGKAEKPDFKNNPTGEWGKTSYKDYTADQLLAAALIRLIRNTDPKKDIVSKDDCNEAITKNFYSLLSSNIREFYKNFTFDDNGKQIHLYEWLTDNFGNVMANVNTYANESVFKTSYSFTKDSFDAIFTKIETEDSILKCVNNIIYNLIKETMNSGSFTTLGLIEGGNENLNENILRIIRFVLPYMSKYNGGNIDGYDFSAFTEKAVETMSTEQIAVAVLKLFYKDWFKSSYDETAVKSAATLDQLGVAAVAATYENKEWFDFDGANRDIDLSNLSVMKESDCLYNTFAIGAILGTGVLLDNADKTHFDTSLIKNVYDWKTNLDVIAKWGVGFIDGIPAASKTNSLLTDTTGNDGFYKINVVLNELIDFSFLNGVNNSVFKLDIRTLLEKVLSNIYSFNISGVLSIFENNTKTDNILNKQLIPAVLGVVDRIVTAIFKTSNNYAKTPVTCTTDSFTNGIQFIKTCTMAGASVATCTNCLKVKFTDKGKIDHTRVPIGTAQQATCGKKGITAGTKCSVCGSIIEAQKDIPATGKHTFVKGICSVCGEKDPDYIPYTLGDIDGKDGITVADARCALRFAVKLDIPTETEKLAADVNKNGDISVEDARNILRVAVKLDSTF